MLNFTLKQLRYVEAAGRLGSIAGAASKLNISQSSITAAIDVLEAELGYDLFLRTPAKGIHPTSAGFETLKLIRSYLDQTLHFEADLLSVGGAETGFVKLACYSTAAPSFLPPVLKSITTRFPNLSLSMLEGHMEMIINCLDSGEVDLVFTYERSVDHRHTFHALFAAPPYALIATTDPLSQQTEVTPAQLATRPMVLLDLPFTRDYFTSLFDGMQGVPTVAHSTRSSEMVRALVSAGFGFSILNIRPLEYGEGVAENTAYHALPIRPAGTAPIFGIATTATAKQPKIVLAFIETCLNLKAQGAFDRMLVF